jgi:hypothetical protein
MISRALRRNKAGAAGLVRQAGRFIFRECTLGVATVGALASMHLLHIMKRARRENLLPLAAITTALIGTAPSRAETIIDEW